ncbi:MAG: Gfo/Idh/MocA family oxidoreductase [Chloroflexota bacterium]
MKALFCGLGSIGQRHLRNLRALLGDSVEILAYRSRGSSPVLNADMTVRAGAELEATYNIRSFSTLDDALAERPEMVFVTNPNTLHLPVALAAARAGCHLFIEKPVSHSLEGVDELVALVERQKLVALVAYQFRFHPGLRWIKAALDAGRIGQLASAHIVNGEYLPDWHPYEDYRETHPARRDLGGGSLRIQTHEIDYALWLFGMPKRLFAAGGQVSRLEVDVEDSVSLLLACEQAGRSFPVHVHLDYLQRPPQRVCEIVGDAGKLRYDYYTGEVVLHDLISRDTETYSFKNRDRNTMFLDELRHFLACIRGDEQPLIDLREGINSLRISLAADESLRTMQSIELG